MPIALITGASRGLGLATAQALADRGWSLVLDARGAVDLGAATIDLDAVCLPGDVADPAHRAELVDAVRTLGRLDLLINNASILGPSPQPLLRDYPLDVLRMVYEVNVLAPLALCQQLLPWLADGTVVNVTSDAAVEPYEGWGGYGSSKAALEQVSAVLAAEEPAVRIYAFDPGDMRTAMHQAAFPGEDISDRPVPESVVPALLRLVDERPTGVRHRAADLATAVR
jgi:NAD(P)-dependent dehydrogenase (short-subunit alcohol dehydrogenase family)